MLDEKWAREQLEAFLEVAELRPAVTSYKGTVGTDRDILEQSQVADLVLDQVLPGWRDTPSHANIDHWDDRRDACVRALVVLDRGEEIRVNLGYDAPRLDASHLHPWVWEGARSLWQSGHYGEAVRAASRKVNAEAQNKLARRDIGETKLLQQAFSTDPPEPRKPRLRLSADDGSDTFKSLHVGAGAFAHGCYGALRNPGSHEVEVELLDDEALERLAAFSILARWIDAAEVLR